MPRSENQKVKILHIAQYFLQNSDPEHYVAAADIIDYLEDLGITAERRSVYRDIYALRDIFGMDIEGSQGTNWKLASRQFETYNNWNINRKRELVTALFSYIYLLFFLQAR